MAGNVGPVGAIRAMISEGISPTAGLRAYRKAGGRIGNERWFAAYSALQREVSTRDRIQAAPVNRLPVVDEITAVPSKRPGAYLYRGAILTFDKGGTIPIVKYGSIRSRRLLTYRAAIEILQQQVEDNADAYGVSVVGAYVTAVNQLVEPGAVQGVFDA